MPKTKISEPDFYVVGCLDLHMHLYASLPVGVWETYRQGPMIGRGKLGHIRSTYYILHIHAYIWVWIAGESITHVGQALLRCPKAIIHDGIHFYAVLGP